MNRVLPELAQDGVQSQLNLTVSDQVRARLDRIPSLTARQERLLLYNFFRSFWRGQGNVIEIGPLLGGTTRAIALGMLHRPDRPAGSKLYTVDSAFTVPIDETMARYVQSAQDHPRATEDEKLALAKSRVMLEVFEALHLTQDYAELLEIRTSALPQQSQDILQIDQLFEPDAVLYDAVFVDGCKSWFSTKFFMRSICRWVEPGTVFLFQDYGYFQTFWVAAFVGAFPDHFELMCSAHNTYAFSLRKPLSEDDLDRLFPDDFEETSEPRFREIFDRLGRGALARKDMFAVRSHRLHLAAALAYLGLFEESLRTIRDVATDPFIDGYGRQLCDAAIACPTYRADRSLVEFPSS